MKNEISPGVIVAVLVVVVAVLGVVAWRVLSPPPPPADTPEARATAQKWVEAFKSQARSGQPSGGAIAPARAPASTAGQK
ncbi:MAG TPA: hypothetical protein VFB21_12480 [Chthonomonadaceae bacterium]|nr:hypothetical protein [Chthonomonadaceae bacterium]